MSDTLGENPYAYGTPEHEQFNKGAIRSFALGASAIPVGAATALAPNLSHGWSLSSIIPGALSGTYSTADAVQKMAQRAMGTPPEAVKALPGAEEADKMAAASSAIAEHIPYAHPDPNNSSEVAVSQLGKLVGQVGFPVPSGLPAALSIPLRAMLPGPRAVMPAVVASGALSAVANAQEAQQASPPTSPQQPATQAAPQQPTTQPTTQQPAAIENDYFSPTPKSILPTIAHYESGDRNINNIPTPGQPHSSASGHYQIIDGTWRQFAPQVGVDVKQYPTALSAPKDVQTAVATEIYNQQGLAPWSSNAPLMQAVGNSNVPASAAPQPDYFAPQKMAQAATEPDYFSPQKPVDYFGNTPDPIAAQDKTHWTNLQALVGIGAGVVTIWAGRKIAPFGLNLAKEKFSPTPIGQAELPGTTGSATTAFRASTVDATAPAKEFLKSTADTPVIGNQLQAKYGDITNAQASVHRYQSELSKGSMHGTNMPSLMEWQQDGAALTPEQKQLFTIGMHYGNEIDNRFANFNEHQATKGFLPTDEMTRVNFTDKDLSELHQGLNAALADPQVKSLMDRAKMQTDAMADMMVAHGQASMSEAQLLKDAHKYYVPSSDMDHVVENPMNSRNIEPYSGSNALPDVFELRDQHDYQLYKMIDDNNARDMLITAHENWHSNTGGVHDRVMEPSKNPVDGKWVAKDNGGSIAVRRNGELQHWQVNNRAFLDAISGSSVKAGATLGALNKIRQVSQSTMTGALSVLTGHLFPVINAGRSAGEITALRPKGMYGGFLDKGLQRATGGKLAFRGDPTAYLGTAYHMVVDPAAEVSRALGEMFSPKAPNGINTRMRSMFGDAAADVISQRALAAYNLSNRAKMRAEGSIGSGGYTANDVTGGIMSNKATAQMPSYDMVPELFQANRWAGTAPFFVHMKNLFNDVKGAIGDAAHSNFDALNRDNPHITEFQRKYEVRNSTGDPSLHGSGGFANYMSKGVPFGNVAMQEGARVARSWNEAPFATALGYTAAYGPLMLASVYTAMLAGPEAVQHLFDRSTDAQRSGTIPFYIPSQPTNPIELPVQINMRAGISLGLQMAYDMLGLATHDTNPDLAGHVLGVLSAFFSKHVWQSTVNGVVKGVSDSIPPITPAGASAGNTLLNGRSLEVNAYNAYMNADKPINEKFTYATTGANAHVPGLAGTLDPVTGTATGEMLQHVISDILATFGVTVLGAANQVSIQSKHDGTLGDVVHNVMQGYGMRARDSVMGANTLWGTPRTESAHTPLSQRVQASLDVMRPTQTYKGDLRYFGFTGAKGELLPVAPDQQKVPSDPTMLAMYSATSKYMNMLEMNPVSPMKEISNIRKEINSLANSPLAPEAVRVQKNALIEREQDANVKLMAQIHNLNGALSSIAGVPVDIQKVDWSKPATQFKR